MSLIIGSARIDENRNIKCGKAGDQKQASATNDTKGEVSMQNFYVHSKGWIILRFKEGAHANAAASSMRTACNNSNIGYDQNQRTGILKYGTATAIKTEAGCSSLVRQCVKEATGIDPGNFNTGTEVNTLKKTGLFKDPIMFESLDKTPLFTGDILVTKTRGHTVIVVSGNERAVEVTSDTYYNACDKSFKSIVDALKSVGETDTSLSHRVNLAVSNNVPTSNNTRMNTKLLELLKAGKLIKN